MLHRVEPDVVLCYNKPFPEMGGNVHFVDYELSSWKHENEDAYDVDNPLFLSLLRGWDNFMAKGMGSAHGGEWKPAKEEDERFLGVPGEIIRSRHEGKKGSYDRETKIGEDGRATNERHHSDHSHPTYHTNPHDHEIDWSDGFPNLGPPTNYPDGAPIFKNQERN